MKFKFLTGDINWQTYGGKFISKKLNNGDFDYWLVLEVINWVEAVGEREAKEVGATYNVTLSAVSPSEAGEENIEKALRCCGIESDEIEKYEDNPLALVEMLHGYGVVAPLWQENGSNLKNLLKKAREQAMCLSLFP